MPYISTRHRIGLHQYRTWSRRMVPGLYQLLLHLVAPYATSVPCNPRQNARHAMPVPGSPSRFRCGSTGHDTLCQYRTSQAPYAML
eukprot:3162096-Rhodomonas_salina.2